MKHLSLMLLLGLSAVSPCWAAPAPVANKVYDSRLKTLTYNPAAIVRLDGCLNFQTMISFGPDERIENVGVGDSSQWQVMPNKRGDLLFVKPLIGKAFSNMTVVTDKRSYNFELRNAAPSDCAHGHVVYQLRFTYPPDPASGTLAHPSAAADPNSFLPLAEKRNSAYTFSGEAGLVPMRVFDDGTSTYMRWPTGVATPAVYAVNADNSESLINYANRGDYLVVEQIARAFILRNGTQKTTLYNDNYRVQGLDDLSPKPRGKGDK